MASDKYANLPKIAHDWLNSQTQDPTNNDFIPRRERDLQRIRQNKTS